MENDENKVTTESTETEFSAQDYIDKLNDIKSGMVDKEKYEKLMKENKQLVEALANGGGYQQEEKEEQVDISALSARLFGKKKVYRNDLEYFADVMTYRDAVIGQGGEDPFLPYNHEYRRTQADEDRAEEIANEIKECIEYADGDPQLFTQELQRRGVKFEKKMR